MSRTDAVFVFKIQTPADREACFAIRREVFIEEQKVPPEAEFDEYDETALHFLAVRGGEPVGTARVRFKDNGATAKIERVAVRKAARRGGAGLAIMRAVEADAAVCESARFVLHAQLYAVPFYERAGYRAEGEGFTEDEIPHRFMSKQNGNRMERRA